ncbi:hypothetical protein BHE74_00044686 [Ensete ventricosum]|nr:hypothetical protein BHE74_00044686 [Ensete ventricosum]RZS20068.1 hypothetical protein BHM03_00052553 [Ensete ventricosum]
MGKGTDLWDDSALIDAFDHAMATYKVRFSSFSSFYLRLLGCSFSLPCIVGLLRCSFVDISWNGKFADCTYEKMYVYVPELVLDTS